MDDEVFLIRGQEADREEMRALAMCMATLGIELRVRSFSDRSSVGDDGRIERKLCWYLHAEGNGRKAADVLKRWRDEAWRAANPWDPVTVIWQFWQNMKGALAHEPGQGQLVFKRGLRRLAVPRSWNKGKIEESLKKLEDGL
jgi:hypothetical protein